MKSITLQFKQGPSDKVYQAHIEPHGENYVVNVAYGRRGSTLQTGTKTPIPVEWEKATKVYEKIVNEKKAKGYTESPSGTPYQHSDKLISGLQCQLLNPIREDEVDCLITHGDWCLQEKFDGQRLLLKKQGAEITGINRKGLIVGIPKTLIESARTIASDFVIDGECIGDTLVVFDVLECGGRDCRQFPYSKRLVELINLLASGLAPCLPIVQSAYSSQEKASLYKSLKARKAEGVVFKLLEAPYTAGRPSGGGSQLKHKFYATLSAVVAKVNPQRSIEMRLLDADGWHTAGNVTIPPNHPVPAVGAVVEIRYLYAMPGSRCLYQPVYRGLRPDLAPHECVVSQLKFKAEGVTPSGSL